MKPEIVIATYRPHEGRDEALLEIVGRHMPALREAGLVTDRPSILCRSDDGTVPEADGRFPHFVPIDGD